MDYTKLDKLKEKLDSFRPLQKGLLNKLREDLIIRWTYHSNAIEGNTLTLMETRVVLEGITVGGKTMNEHLEAINHREAIAYMESLVTKNKPLSERDIKDIHRLILKQIDNENAGAYRLVNVSIVGAKHIPPDALHITEEMECFINWYKSKAGKLHPVERAAKVHTNFVKIHSFIDGNGRTARLLMNLELMKSGFPPAITPVERRLEYFNALDTAHTQNNYHPFLKFTTQMVEQAFEPYWFALGEK